MTALSPLSGKTDLVSFSIMINGAPMPDTYQVWQVRVQKQVNRISNAKITLYDGNPSSEAFAISSSSSFLPGVTIEILAGYESVENTIFKGIVTRQGVKVKSDGKSYLTVTCYDKALAMTLGRKSAYVGKSDSDAFSTIISAAGLTPNVTATTTVQDEIVRYYATDWDFLVARAEINGQIVLVDNAVVTVQPPQVDAEPVLLIEYGDALLEINAEMDASVQLPTVQSSAWDMANQAVVSGTSSEPAVNSQGNISGQQLSQVLNIGAFNLQLSTTLPSSELQSWANAQLLKSRLAKIRGTVSFRGNASPKPGQTIQLEGCGTRFNGNAFMSSVVHTIESGNWITEVGMGLSPNWFVNEMADIEAPPASGVIPGVGGLIVGTVKQIDQDPEGQNRVLVVAPLINPAGDGIWARLASNYATNKAGIFFMPEIGDEVVLGFLNEDPSFPIILGSLYSSKNVPPFTPDAANTNKAVVTKGQLKITMDDEKKITVISTPGGQIITLSDDAKSITIEDSNKNTITLSDSGITLNSPKDINLSANGNVNISAKGAMTLKASTNMTSSAANISTSASASLSLSGDASAKLNSSGVLTIKGAMVLIN
ncbi:type VI secretion system tip protein VgrG [Undibacterium sp. SXout7W]|uniref:type VI secretion system tip protein VgrG n=1 Tax=Undibacterium sp. SXout7W TaxID=3413049 RepID=UPI003BF2B557